MHANLRDLGRTRGLRQRQRRRIRQQQRLGQADRAPRRDRPGAERGRRPHRRLAALSRHVRPHPGDPGHCGPCPRRRVDSRLHAAGTRPRARHRRGRLLAVPVRAVADRFRARTPVPGASGLELVQDHHHLELWPRPRPVAPQRAPRLDATRARRRALRRGHNGAHDESGQQDVVCAVADRARRHLFRLCGLAPGYRQASDARRRQAPVSLVSARLGDWRPRRGGRRDDRCDGLAGRLRRSARRAGGRFLRPRLHHSCGGDRHPDRREPSHSRRRRAAVGGRSFRPLGRQSRGRAARLRRGGDRPHRPPHPRAGLRALAIGAARRRKRQEDHGSRRRAGRRVEGRLLDGARALEPARSGPGEGRRSRPASLCDQFGVRRQRRIGRLRRDAANGAGRARLQAQAPALRRPECAGAGDDRHAVPRPAAAVPAGRVPARPGRDAGAFVGGGLG